MKYSIESVDDLRHKSVRGEASNFTQAYRNILKLLELKAQRNYKTTIVITMINLNKPWQREEYQKLVEAFEGLDVYVYLKSQDQMWYEDNKQTTASIHWQEFCQFPWSSMTVKSNGECAQCVEDFNNEIILAMPVPKACTIFGKERLTKASANDHFILKPGIKCTEQMRHALDWQLLGSIEEPMRNIVKIGERIIGDDQPVYIVGEIGINHNGDLEVAKSLMLAPKTPASMR